MSFLNLFKKYKSFVTYVFFGICTTVVNILSYRMFYNVFDISNVSSTIFAWFLAVFFAFITNKIWVFASKNWALKLVILELVKFIMCRIVTGIIDVFIMWFSVDKMKMNAMIFKLISNIIVIILNYIASKFIIFIQTNKLRRVNENK